MKLFEFNRILLFELIFLLQLVMQDFLRQRLMLCQQSSSRRIHCCYCLLLIEIFTMRCELDRRWSSRSFIVSFLESTFAESILACDDTKFLQSHQIQFCCLWCERYSCFDWISVNFIEVEIFYRLLDFELYCIHAISQSHAFWYFAVKAKRSKSLRVVFRWSEYKKFISHRSFDKLRRFFQSFWCS